MKVSFDQARDEIILYIADSIVKGRMYPDVKRDIETKFREIKLDERRLKDLYKDAKRLLGEWSQLIDGAYTNIITSRIEHLYWAAMEKQDLNLAHRIVGSMIDLMKYNLINSEGAKERIEIILSSED